MKTIRSSAGEFVFCDNCEQPTSLAVELRDGSRLCAECVGIAAELVRDASSVSVDAGDVAVV